MISPSNPAYLRVSAHERPAGPAPTITNLLGSEPWLVIGTVCFLFNRSLGTLICN